MPKVTYVGPFDVVEIAATRQVVHQGAQVEVSDQLAASLCEQSDSWQPAPAPAKPPKE